MFADTEIFNDISEELLSLFDMEEILEMNNLTNHEVICILLEGGHLGYPRDIIDGLQEQEG